MVSLRRNVQNFRDVSHNFNVLNWLVGGHIDGEHIQYGAISTNHIQVGSVTEEQIAEGTLGDMAWEDAVEKAKLGTTIIEGGYLVTGMVNASRIDAGTLHANRIGANSITATHIASNTITADLIAAGFVWANDIQTEYDVTVGRNLVLSTQNFQDGIEFRDPNSPYTLYGEVFVDPAAESIIVKGGKGASITLGTSARVWGSSIDLQGDVEIGSNFDFEVYGPARFYGNAAFANIFSTSGNLTINTTTDVPAINVGNGASGSFECNGTTVTVNNGIVTGIS